MKFYLNPAILIVALMITSFGVNAQDQKISKAFKEQTVNQLAELINEFYVLPDVARSTSDHLMDQWKEGAFDSIDQYESFADALTTSVQSINKDKHMRVMLLPPYEAAANTPERIVEEQLDRIDRTRKSNGGFNSVEILEGNVGYLDIRSFAGMDLGKDNTDAYMKLLSLSDAIIIDLRNNTGGSPVMVQYLCSYFFDEHLNLNNLYFRRGDELHEFWTLDEVGGIKMPDVPLFVMTSDKTFSGAEEFAYNMQTQKRATIIGQITGGGANPGQSMNLNEKLRVIMPMGMAINPVTNTNWEGTGVIPDIEVSSEETFDSTHQLAIDAAEGFRKKTEQFYSNLYTALYKSFDTYTEGESEENILHHLKACSEQNLLQEQDINMLGYDFLMEQNKPKIAECIFRANTILFPESPNTYDSYGEALMNNGHFDTAVENYQKAVDIATRYNYPDIELYQKNLDLVKNKIKSDK